MVGEDHIRDLIGRMECARSRGFRITPSTAGLIIDALRFYLLKQGWMTILPAAFPKPYHPMPRPDPGPPPTIGHVKDEGIKSFSIICRTPKCWQEKLFTFDELGLPDEMIFIHIPHNRRFRCSACGGHDVRVYPNNLESWASGTGRPQPADYKPLSFKRAERLGVQPPAKP